MTTTLDYVIVGYVTHPNQDDKTLKRLAYSEGLPAQDIRVYQQAVNITPLPIDDERLSQSMAMTRFDDETVILARAHYQHGNFDLPIYQYILIPYDVLAGIGARLNPLLSLITNPIPVYSSADQVVPPLVLPPISTGNLNVRVEQIETLIDDILEHQFELAMSCLGALIHERHLVVKNFPQNLDRRMDFIQGLRMLLPSAIAIRVSFSSHVTTLGDVLLHVTFADDVEGVDAWVMDYHDLQINPSVLEHPYIALLRQLWMQDMVEFVAAVRPMDIISLSYVKHDSLSDNLAELTERFAIDLQVEQHDVVDTALMIHALESESAPQGRLRYQYIKKLLQNALDNRDTVAGKRVAEELNRDENLDHALASVFEQMLESQPDTVYVFVRNRLNHIGVDDRWISRLQTAAKNSLDVAIDEGDIQTLVSWLELVAREPTTYELDDVLREYILKAQPRARDNGELGINLIMIAARRLPDVLEQLYDDVDLMNALPSDVGQALRHSTTQTVEALLNDDDAQYALLAIRRSTQADPKPMISKPIVDRLWALYQADYRVNLPTMYHPISIVRQLVTDACEQLTEDAVDTLLDDIITANHNILFVEFATTLARRDRLFPRLNSILQNRERPIEQVQAFINWVGDIEQVTSVYMCDMYLAVLDFWQWSPETQPVLEAFSRLVAQDATLELSHQHMWQFFEVSNSLQIESAVRVAINRLLSDIQTYDSPEDIARDIGRVYETIRNNKASHSLITQWWQTFVQSCSLIKLQRIDQALQLQRVTEAPRDILQTAIAMRKLMNNQDLAMFADAVGTAYSILERITDSFDRPQLDVNADTIRHELDHMNGELSTEERYVLAKNLRELAQLVVWMSDKRSKSSLMRNDEVIDRQLMRGDANPQGSIDMMKWIAGYLDGAHDVDED